MKQMRVVRKVERVIFIPNAVVFARFQCAEDNGLQVETG